MESLRVIAGVLAVFLLLTGVLFVLPEETTADRPPEIRFLRAMSSNPDVCLPVEGEYYDWLELINLSDGTVDLTGWRLSQEVDVRNAYVLPPVVLEPMESVVIYAAAPETETAEDGTVITPGGEIFCGFTLDADGDRLTLYDSRYNPCDEMELPALAAGMVWALDPETGGYAQRSPFEDTGTGVPVGGELVPDGTETIRISEIMAANGDSLRDGSGETPDWIEICNTGAEAVDLEGYTLTDNAFDRRQFVFPSAVLQPGEYLIVFASGTERREEELHAGFRLSAEGESVMLFDPMGGIVSRMDYEGLETDQSAALQDGGVVKTFLVSPGHDNTDEGARSAIDPAYLKPLENGLGLYINEVVCSMQDGPDWVELHNASSVDLDISGFGLSDNPKQPRRWRFPEGTVIPAGGYRVVALDGDGKWSGVLGNMDCADFSLSVTEEELLVLSDAAGERIDCMLLENQQRNVSYGRAAGLDAYRYFTQLTMGAANAAGSYEACAADVVFSHPGGVQPGAIELEMSSGEGMTIYYTTDGTTPTIRSRQYTGPVSLSSTTVIKAIAWREGAIPSPMQVRTYIFGADHQLGIVSVSGPRSDLNGSGGMLNTGISGDGADVYVEIYGADGTRLIGQECLMKLNGRSTRRFDQRAFRLVAKSEYGEGRFKAPLFSERDYESYNSVVVRASGQDVTRTLMRDSMLTSLARGTSVMYQENETVVVYVNGEFWGLYHLRERLEPESICQFEGWDNPDAIDYLESNSAVVIQGSNATFHEMMKLVRRYGVASEENLEALRGYMDVENYLEYVIFEMYSNNQDMNNVRMYRNPQGDGQWHWVLFDLDLSFMSGRDAVSDWMSTSAQVGTITQQDNTLFIELMKNPTARDYFLTRFGELLATNLSTENVLARIEEEYNLLYPEMERQRDRWGTGITKWQQEGGELIAYARGRAMTLIGQLVDEFNLNAEQTQHYFGEAIAVNGG